MGKILKGRWILIDMEEYIQIKNELLDKIESFKKQNLASNKIIIKRMEIEPYIENVANSLSIDYKKDFYPTNTIYHFCFYEQQLQMKILFRYGTYYTRHQIIDPYK